MFRNKESRSVNSGPNEKHSTTKSKRFSISDYKQFGQVIQCKHCRSEYMRFAVNGYCQRCQQRAEYVLRERTGTVDTAGAGEGIR